ncbi:MAG: hypothetical protein R3A13_03430 [Bdellovibrionota bacterium]
MFKKWEMITPTGAEYISTFKPFIEADDFIVVSRCVDSQSTSFRVRHSKILRRFEHGMESVKIFKIKQTRHGMSFTQVKN